MTNILKSLIKASALSKALILTGLIFYNPVNSQLDRSVMPESGPAPEIFFGKPNTFKLDNGLTIMVVENSKLPRASASLSFDNPLIFEGEVAGVSSILGEMIGNGTQTISKEKFLEEVDFMGASMSVSGSGAFASSLSRYFPRVLELMADAVLNPLLTQEEFNSQKNLIKESLKQLDDLTFRERWVFYPLIGLTLFLGIFPSPVLSLIGPSVASLVIKLSMLG